MILFQLVKSLNRGMIAWTRPSMSSLASTTMYVPHPSSLPPPFYCLQPRPPSSFYGSFVQGQDRLTGIPKLILHIPFVQSLRPITLYLLPPPPSHPLRPTSLKLFVNLPHCPGFSEVGDMRPVMDVDLSQPPKGITRTVDGQRDVEEWGLKVQKMASVHSVTLVFVSSSSSSPWSVR